LVLLQLLTAIYAGRCLAETARRSRLCQHHQMPRLFPARTRLRSCVADQRLPLAPKNEKEDAENTEQAPARRLQNRDHEGVPQIATGIGPDYRLKLGEASGIDQLPQRPHA